ncbi:MAG TPA: malto-oligosyltrehalose synthase, partial [Steroidobacteraceae bacterium]
VERALRRFNGGTGPARVELDALIQRQYWRASHFRVAGDDINYRRFFNINDLAALRVELPDVFEHIHRMVAQLLRNGVIDGLRIDHIDGLLDPGQYLARLRAMALDPGGASRPFYLVVEKILADGEYLPAEWQVEGTTGYEFGNQVLRLLTDARGEEALTAIWREFSGERATFEEIVRDSKIFIMKNEMASELNVLARNAARVARQNSRTADFTRRILHRALRATVACFPVYRTYLDSRGELSDADRRRILVALEGARALERDLDPSVFDFLELLLTGALVGAPHSGFSRHAALRCAMKFQQFSGPVMAKGLEDTAFYRYNRLISHNEVGGDPRHLGGTLAHFHEANQERLRSSPASLLGTSTHDTKRGEDVRMRLATLAEIPEEWSERVRSWHRLLAEDSRALDDAGLEYFFYQTLLGSFPVAEAPPREYRDRLQGAIIKAAREARRRTSWARPNEEYEARLIALIDGALQSAAFLDDFLPFHRRVARAGAENSLVQTVLKLTLPGVPDIYQGTELWDLSLVDPDNRRPVDYAARAALLEGLLDQWERLPYATVREAAEHWQDGRIKLLLTALLLRLRTADEALFAGEYLPWRVAGQTGDVGSFVRRAASSVLLVAFARFPFARDREAIQRIELPDAPGPWYDAFSRENVPANGFDWRTEPGLPVTVLVSRAGSHSN